MSLRFIFTALLLAQSFFLAPSSHAGTSTFETTFKSILLQTLQKYFATQDFKLDIPSVQTGNASVYQSWVKTLSEENKKSLSSQILTLKTDEALQASYRAWLVKTAGIEGYHLSIAHMQNLASGLIQALDQVQFANEVISKGFLSNKKRWVMLNQENVFTQLINVYAKSEDSNELRKIVFFGKEFEEMKALGRESPTQFAVNFTHRFGKDETNTELATQAWIEHLKKTASASLDFKLLQAGIESELNVQDQQTWAHLWRELMDESIKHGLTSVGAIEKAQSDFLNTSTTQQISSLLNTKSNLLFAILFTKPLNFGKDLWTTDQQHLNSTTQSHLIENFQSTDFSSSWIQLFIDHYLTQYSRVIGPEDHEFIISALLTASENQQLPYLDRAAALSKVTQLPLPSNKDVYFSRISSAVNGLIQTTPPPATQEGLIALQTLEQNLDSKPPLKNLAHTVSHEIKNWKTRDHFSEGSPSLLAAIKSYCDRKLKTK